MEAKIKELVEEQGKAFEAFKTAHKKEIETQSAEHKAKTEELNTKLSEYDKQISDLKAAMNRTQQQQQDQETEEQKSEKKYSTAFKGYLRKGSESQDLMEHKAHSVNSDEDGGYLVTPAMNKRIIEKIFESSPLRQLADVITIATDKLTTLEDLDEVESGWAGETAPRGNTATAKLKIVDIPTHELFAQPKATQKILDDAGINLEQWLSNKASKKFARDEATAFISGNGVNKPKGILSYDVGDGFNKIEQIEGSTSLAIVGDDWIDLEFSLKEEYRKNGAFLAQRQTIKSARKLKGSDGHYIWAPGLNGKTQSTILGYPVYEAADMQANGVAGNLAVAFGDFKEGYQIVDRQAISLLRDPYTGKPFVLFYFRKRVGGGVINFEAIKLLKIKA